MFPRTTRRVAPSPFSQHPENKTKNMLTVMAITP
jgi:hypothetical protein